MPRRACRAAHRVVPHPDRSGTGDCGLQGPDGRTGCRYRCGPRCARCGRGSDIATRSVGCPDPRGRSATSSSNHESGSRPSYGIVDSWRRSTATPDWPGPVETIGGQLDPPQAARRVAGRVSARRTASGSTTAPRSASVRASPVHGIPSIVRRPPARWPHMVSHDVIVAPPPVVTVTLSSTTSSSSKPSRSWSRAALRCDATAGPRRPASQPSGVGASHPQTPLMTSTPGYGSSSQPRRFAVATRPLSKFSSAACRRVNARC